MTEGSKAVFHALSVALLFVVLAIVVGITIGAVINHRWLWTIAGLIGTVAVGVWLRQAIRNRPGIDVFLG